MAGGHQHVLKQGGICGDRKVAVRVPFRAGASARDDSEQERIVVIRVPDSVKPSPRTAFVSSFTI